ncbi:glycosyltransferase [Devosia algicola]|uniref:Glycosyltransferase n=1 Tax=Devosia algicola TaxID=3026418 RepID=A0ABY7YSL2_9HYPH|nr:glycosyltransferase [Devosia algicola]WDR04353.1 glycosyltransferase [Devosia algicola]
MAVLLSGMGHDVTVLTGKPNYPQGTFYDGYHGGGISREHLGDVLVVRIPMMARGYSRIGLALNYLSFILSASLLGPWALRGQKVDIVFVYGISPLLQALPAVLLAKLRRIPLVVWVQDLWPDSLTATGHVRNRMILRVVSALVRLIYRSSDRILVQSRAFIEPVAKYAEVEKIHYYPNPYLEKRSTQVSEKVARLASDIGQQFSVVFAGNLGTGSGAGHHR